MSDTNFRVSRGILLLIFSAVAAGGCASQSEVGVGAFQKEITSRGFASFNQPIGNPNNPNDWEKFGPGVVLRTKNQTYYYPAKMLISEPGVQRAMDLKNASPISLFSGKRVSGYDIDGKGGWTIDAANKIAGSLQLKNVTDVEIQFGNARLAGPLSEGELHQALRVFAKDMDEEARTALRKGLFSVVQNVVIADSVRYYFKQKKEGGGSVQYKLSDQEIANLEAKHYRVIDGGVEVAEPRFIAFTPLPNPWKDIPR
jgi:hypothetical protein